MNNTIIIFDLDDTLVNSKMKIPRQTYHMLNYFKKKNYLIGVISYNCMVQLVAKETNLNKYTDYIFYKDTNRDILFDTCVNQMKKDYDLSSETQIYYMDDRLDNLQAVAEKNPNVIPFHCCNMYKLHTCKQCLEL